MPSNVRITLVSVVSDDLVRDFGKLIPQLSPSALAPTRERLERIVADSNTQIIAAQLDNGRTVGVLTLTFMTIPTGEKAVIDDVVTDVEHRGSGIGRMLVEMAVAEARRRGVGQVVLTSNPSRTAARKLYAGCGFQPVDTTLFRLLL